MLCIITITFPCREFSKSSSRKNQKRGKKAKGESDEEFSDLSEDDDLSEEEVDFSDDEEMRVAFESDSEAEGGEMEEDDFKEHDAFSEGIQ